MLNNREYLEIKMPTGLVTDGPTEAVLPDTKYQALTNCYNELGALKMRLGSAIITSSTVTATPFGLSFATLLGTGYHLFAYNTSANGFLATITESGTIATLINNWTKTGTELSVANFTFTKDNLPETAATQALVVSNGIDLPRYWDGTNLVSFGLDSGELYFGDSTYSVKSTENMFVTENSYATPKCTRLAAAANADVVVGIDSTLASSQIKIIKNNGETVYSGGAVKPYCGIAISGDGLTIAGTVKSAAMGGGNRGQYSIDGGISWDTYSGEEPLNTFKPFVSEDGGLMVVGYTEASGLPIYEFNNSIQISDDAGTSWVKCTDIRVYGPMRTTCGCAGSADGNILYVPTKKYVEDNSLYLEKSGDRGATFSPCTPPVLGALDGSLDLDGRVGVVSCDPTGSFVTLAVPDGDDTRIYSSVDGGDNWKAEVVIADKIVTDIVHYKDKKTAIISFGETGVSTTTDGGTTWNTVATTSIISSVATSADNYLNLTAAKYVENFAGCLVLANVTENGGAKPNRVRISNPGKIYGYRDRYIDIPEAIVGIRKLRGDLYVFGQSKVHKITELDSETLPFELKTDISDYTCFYNACITEVFDHLVYQAQDYTIRAFDGTRAFELSSGNRTLLQGNKLRSSCWSKSIGAVMFSYLTANVKTVVLKLGRMLNPAVEIGESYNLHEESYPNTVAFLSAGSTTTFCSQVSGTSAILVSMHKAGTLTDSGFSAAATHTMTATSGITYLGKNVTGFIESINVFGKPSSVGGTVSVSATVYPSGTVFTKTFTLQESGFSMPIGSNANAFKLAITNAGAGLKNISKMNIQVKNLRVY